jgi:hypothetical protein
VQQREHQHDSVLGKSYRAEALLWASIVMHACLGVMQLILVLNGSDWSRTGSKSWGSLLRRELPA